jgi:hypothetical protein
MAPHGARAADLVVAMPNALKREHPEDCYENTAAIEWPLGPRGEAFPIFGEVYPAVVLQDGRGDPGELATAGSRCRSRTLSPAGGLTRSRTC